MLIGQKLRKSRGDWSKLQGRDEFAETGFTTQVIALHLLTGSARPQSPCICFHAQSHLIIATTKDPRRALRG